MSARQSVECSVAQLQQTLIHVANDLTTPENTLVVDSNLAVTDCIETNTNVCIGIVDITGEVQVGNVPRSRDTLASIRDQWDRASWSARRTTGPRDFFSSPMLPTTIEGPTGSFPSQNIDNVMIGREVAAAGQDFANIAIGDQTVGSYLGLTGAFGETGATGLTGSQGLYNVAIGYQTAYSGQGEANIALGAEAAAEGQLYGNIAIGNPASAFQNTNNISIGVFSAYSQNEGNIAIGSSAASGGQDSNAIAIGSFAAYGEFFGGIQGTHSIAIGSAAGADASPVPEYSTQIGYQATVYSNYEPEGLFNAGIAIGPNSSSSQGALVLNTDINGLTGSGPGLFIQPVRQLAPTSTQYVATYDTSSHEISYMVQMISGSVGSGGSTGTINFGITFASTPSVVLTIANNSDPGQDIIFSSTVYNITPTQFSYRLTYISDTSGGVQPAGNPFSWTAIGYYLD